MKNYPVAEKHFDSVATSTGKKLSDITLDNVMKGEINAEDIKISKETLQLQGKVAGENGRTQIEKNFYRASELVNVPDKVILKIYESLRPNRSTRSELIAIAKELKDKYQAIDCARMVLEAARIYEARGILIKERVTDASSCGS